jgi:F-type H+-transporting ATPase subunit b
MEILNQLGIDPAVMLAQAINFFVLLGILSFLVYKPVLKLLDERKNRILKSEKQAELIENKLARTEEVTQKELKKVQEKSKEILAAARENAKQQETELVAVAQKKVEKIIAEGRAVIIKERDEAAAQIQKEVAKIVLLATEKLLSREINAKDQENFIVKATTEVSELKL